MEEWDGNGWVVNGRLDGWMGGWMEDWMDRRWDGWMERWRETGWLNGRLDGWMETGWMDSYMNGWIRWMQPDGQLGTTRWCQPVAPFPRLIGGAFVHWVLHSDVYEAVFAVVLLPCNSGTWVSPLFPKPISTLPSISHPWAAAPVPACPAWRTPPGEDCSGCRRDFAQQKHLSFLASDPQRASWTA